MALLVLSIKTNWNKNPISENNIFIHLLTQSVSKTTNIYCTYQIVGIILGEAGNTNKRSAYIPVGVEITWKLVSFIISTTEVNKGESSKKENSQLYLGSSGDADQEKGYIL